MISTELEQQLVFTLFCDDWLERASVRECFLSGCAIIMRLDVRKSVDIVNTSCEACSECWTQKLPASHERLCLCSTIQEHCDDQGSRASYRQRDVLSRPMSPPCRLARVQYCRRRLASVMMQADRPCTGRHEIFPAGVPGPITPRGPGLAHLRRATCGEQLAAERYRPSSEFFDATGRGSFI